MKDRIKRILKPWYHDILHWVREWRIRSCARALRRASPSVEELMPLVSRLRAVWGNTGWTPDEGFLQAMVRGVLASPGPFLECGSGLSTVILGLLAERNATSVWSLEQDEEWVSVLQEELSDLGISTVHLVHAPLEVRSGAAWYDFDDSAFPRRFSMVLCDGPAVRKGDWAEPVYLAWRSGAVRELQRRSMTCDSILLDDADNPRCSMLVDNWRRSGLIVEAVETPSGPHIVGRFPAAAEGIAPGREA
jgi:hypothetical protein